MKPLPLQDWDASLDPVIDDMRGLPLNVHSLLANHPPLLEAWWRLRMYLVKGGDLGQRHCELVILRIAVHMRSWYEWASHVLRGMESGLSLEEIDGLLHNDHQWNVEDAVLIEAVDEIAQQHAISPATLERLSSHYSDQQILDIVHLHGMYTTLACLIKTWGIELDEHVEKRLPGSVRPDTFVTS